MSQENEGRSDVAPATEERTLRVMDPAHGDLKMTWDPDVESEVERVRKTFVEMRGKGFAAFRVDKGGDRAEIMREFDPDARAIIMTPPVSGG